MGALVAAASSRRVGVPSGVTLSPIATLRPPSTLIGSSVNGTASLANVAETNGQVNIEEPLPDSSIAELEDRITRLRKYEKELLELSLVESHGKLVEELSFLENTLRQKKLRKSRALIEKLASEFPGLVHVTKQEIERLGYLT
jgi:hypothetical protein